MAFLFSSLCFKSCCRRCFILGSAPTSTTVAAPMDEPKVFTWIRCMALTFPPVINPLLPLTKTSVPAITSLCRIDSVDTYPLALTVAFSRYLAITFPSAFNVPFSIPFMPRAIMIFPVASRYAPSTTPLTSISPWAFTEKLVHTFPFTFTLPL